MSSREWDVLPLEDCMEAIIDYRGKTPRKSSFGIPLITAKIVKGGRILEPTEFIPFEDYDERMSRGIPRAGDVVVTTEAPLGEVGQLDNRKLSVGQRLITLRGKDGLLDNTYLKYLMMSEFVQNQLLARATGTTVSGIKQTELRKINLLIPPFTSQRRIADILSALDEKIELNRQTNVTLEAIAQSIFREWFVEFRYPDPNEKDPKGLLRNHTSHQAKESGVNGSRSAGETFRVSGIPQGWRVGKLGEVVEVKGGTTPSTKEEKYWNGEYYFATPKDLSNLNSPILLNTERKITKEGVSQISSGILPEGTLLLSSRAPIGYLAISNIPVSINQGFIAINAKETSNLFILHWLKENMETVISRANGSTFLEITKTNFKDIELVIPDAETINRFEEVVNPIFEQVKNNEQQSATLASLRDALLPKLMSGEIEV